MNRKELENKRFWPCFDEIWSKATNVFPLNFPLLNYSHLQELCPWTQDNDRLCHMVPIDITYLDKDEMKRIVDKWCKGLHGFWYYTPKLDFNDPGYHTKVKELHDFRDFETKVNADKSLTYAQRAAKIRKEALAHNFRWRSNDREFITTNIYLGCTPTSNKEHHKIGQILFDFLRQYLNTGELPMSYHDYTKDKVFPYVEGDIIYTASIENIHHLDGKQEASKSPICNLYDEGGDFVCELWDYEQVQRSMSATTFLAMVDNAVKLVDEHPDDLPESIREIKNLNHGTSQWYHTLIKQTTAALVMMYIQYSTSPKELSSHKE